MAVVKKRPAEVRKYEKDNEDRDDRAVGGDRGRGGSVHLFD